MTRPDNCILFAPIYLEYKDLDVISPQLARQLLRHNETGAKVCKW
ncbi:hypothetical protein [Bartonella sp. DGB1]